jgi:non-ribosomal peptide synthetase component F
VFDAASIATLIRRFQGQLVAMTADPTQPLLSTDLLDGSERARLDGHGGRAVLTQPAHSAVAAPENHQTSGGYRAPATRVEQILAGIYAHVLGVDRVGIDESFFDLGGDSLSAMRTVAAINATLNTHLAVPAIINTPSIRSLSHQLATQPNPAKPHPTPTSDR